MRNILFLILLSVRAYSQVSYPAAICDSVTDNYFGTIVHDPYRWLEDDTQTRTREWLAAETSLSDKYLLKAINRYGLEQQLRYNSYVDFGARNKCGKYYFDYVRTDGQPDASLMLFKKPNTEGYRVANPADYKNGPRDRVEITNFALSPDSKYVAFGVSHNGSDWNEIRITEIFPFRDETDVLKGVKFSNIEWDRDGLFYSRYPLTANILKDSNRNGVLYYHRLGTEQKDDVLIFDDNDNNATNTRFETIAKCRYLIVYHNGPDGNMVLVKDLATPAAGFDTITRGMHASFNVLGEYNGGWLVKTNLGSPKGQLLLYTKKMVNSYTQLVPQYKEVLRDAFVVGDKIVCSYLSETDYVIIIFDATGKPVNHIDFPTGTSVHMVPDLWSDSTILFNYNSFL